jgi:hypothetical protein
MPDVTLGIEVSKDHLDAHRLPDGAARQFANTRSSSSAGLDPRASLGSSSSQQDDITSSLSAAWVWQALQS